VNVFARLVREAAACSPTNRIRRRAWEIHHHNQERRASGTLLKLVGEIITGYTRPIDQSVPIARALIPASHEIGFEFGADTITLRLSRGSREGFARGALKAAQWIPGSTECNLVQAKFYSRG